MRKVVYYSNTTLSHHGILGQRWGDRNGPPYPLGSGDHSSSEKKAGWRKSLQKDSSVPNKIANKIVAKQVKDTTYKPTKKSLKDKWNSLSDKQKKAIKIGATVAVSVLAAYGIYRLIRNSNGTISFVNPGPDTKGTLMDLTIKQVRGQNAAARFFSDKQLADSINYMDDMSYSNHQDINSLAELEQWGTGENTVDNCIKVINPELSEMLDGRNFQDLSYDEQIDILASVSDDRTMNCMFCSTAYELNRRGMKCRANGRLTGGPMTQIADMFEITDKKAILSIDHRATKDRKSVASIINTYVNNYPDGARGNIIVTWPTGGSHSMAWEIINNNFTVIDAQSGIKYSTKSELYDMFSKTIGYITSVRTDNAELIESDALLNALEYLE